MGDGRIFPKNIRAPLFFNDVLSNEPNFGRIHLAGSTWKLAEKLIIVDPIKTYLLYITCYIVRVKYWVYKEH